MLIDDKDFESHFDPADDADHANAASNLPVAVFPKTSTHGLVKFEMRKIVVPFNRITPLKTKWSQICTPIVHDLKLQIRFNTKSRSIEIRSSRYTEEESSLQKAADFVKAFTLGFELEDALALIRLDDLFLESFQVDDVRMLAGDHMGRAVGRVAGKDGRTKFAIENTTRTRIVIADKNIHILGSFNNISLARNAICQLILGSPPSKVYAKLRTVATRLSERT